MTTKKPSSIEDWLLPFYTDKSDNKTKETVMLIHRAFFSDLGTVVDQKSAGYQFLIPLSNYKNYHDSQDIWIHPSLAQALMMIGHHHYLIDTTLPNGITSTDVNTVRAAKLRRAISYRPQAKFLYENVLKYYDNMPDEIKQFYDEFVDIAEINVAGDITKIYKHKDWSKIQKINNAYATHRIILRQSDPTHDAYWTKKHIHNRRIRLIRQQFRGDGLLNLGTLKSLIKKYKLEAINAAVTEYNRDANVVTTLYGSRLPVTHDYMFATMLYNFGFLILQDYNFHHGNTANDLYLETYDNTVTTTYDGMAITFPGTQAVARNGGITLPNELYLELNIPSVMRDAYINEIKLLTSFVTDPKSKMFQFCYDCSYRIKNNQLQIYNRHGKFEQNTDMNDVLKNNYITPELICKTLNAKEDDEDKNCNLVNDCFSGDEKSCDKLMSTQDLLNPISDEDLHIKFLPIPTIKLLENLGVQLISVQDTDGDSVRFEDATDYIKRKNTANIMTNQFKANITKLINWLNKDKKQLALINPNNKNIGYNSDRKEPDDSTGTEKALLLQKFLVDENYKQRMNNVYLNMQRFIIRGGASSQFLNNFNYPDYRSKEFLAIPRNLITIQPFALVGTYNNIKSGGSIQGKKPSETSANLINSAVKQANAKGFSINTKDKLKIKKTLDNLAVNEKNLVKALAKIKVYGNMYALTKNNFFNQKYSKVDAELHKINKQIQKGGYFIMSSYTKILNAISDKTN